MLADSRREIAAGKEAIGTFSAGAKANLGKLDGELAQGNTQMHAFSDQMGEQWQNDVKEMGDGVADEYNGLEKRVAKNAEKQKEELERQSANMREEVEMVSEEASEGMA